MNQQSLFIIVQIWCASGVIISQVGKNNIFAILCYAVAILAFLFSYMVKP